MLQAESMGLATCWVAYFEQNDLRPILNVPPDKYILAVIPVGYTDEQPGSDAAQRAVGNGALRKLEQHENRMRGD